MTKTTKINECCEPSSLGPECCKVESVVTIDSKGQVLLPKEVRENTNLKPGDKLVVVNISGKKETCCITLIKADYFEEMVKNFLGPMMDNLFKKSK